MSRVHVQAGAAAIIHSMAKPSANEQSVGGYSPSSVSHKRHTATITLPLADTTHMLPQHSL